MSWVLLLRTHSSFCSSEEFLCVASLILEFVSFVLVSHSWTPYFFICLLSLLPHFSKMIILSIVIFIYLSFSSVLFSEPPIQLSVASVPMFTATSMAWVLPLFLVSLPTALVSPTSSASHLVAFCSLHTFLGPRKMSEMTCSGSFLEVYSPPGHCPLSPVQLFFS